MKSDDLAAEIKADAHSLHASVALRLKVLQTEEFLEDPFAQLGRDTGPGVRHGDLQEMGLKSADRRGHGNLHTAAVWGVLERVSEHVGKHDAEPRGVSLDDCLVASSNKIKADIMLREPRQKLVGEVPRQVQEIDPVEVEPELARLDSREVE